MLHRHKSKKGPGRKVGSLLMYMARQEKMRKVKRKKKETKKKTYYLPQVNRKKFFFFSLREKKKSRFATDFISPAGGIKVYVVKRLTKASHFTSVFYLIGAP